MALPKLEFSKEQMKPSYEAPGWSPAQIDPNILRLIAERNRKQGLASAPSAPSQQAPMPSAGVTAPQAPLDPRLRAAMMLREKLRQRYQGQQAPDYQGVQPRNV